ncbi:DUF4258 domain-containing protein [Bacillus sp. FJAT-28004]|uniref:DUF4258 domain-containing protein n=1 Tax=Bacillus sp. FJAT-28004 TaxID=1679165 RepID=UPI0006B56420|nr:DUF4258 domain-containing protein [Bacillus sp. FJAT-28004]
MKLVFRNFSIALALVMFLNLTLVTSMSANSIENQPNQINKITVSDEYESEMITAFKAYEEEKATTSSQLVINNNTDPMARGLLGHLLKLIFKDMVKDSASATVKATVRNVTTKLTLHTMQRAIERNITNVLIDNVLDEIPSGIQLVQKYDDLDFNSRIMYDPNNKVVVVLDKTANTIITTYDETGNSIETRVKNGRLKAATWKFK